MQQPLCSRRWSGLEAELHDGAIVVLEERRVRLRS